MKGLIKKLGVSVSLVGLVFGTLSFSGCGSGCRGEVYFPAGKSSHLDSEIVEDAKLQEKITGSRDDYTPIFRIRYTCE